MNEFERCLDLHFYDKTMLIMEFLHEKSDVVLITRPLGFFVRSNVAMLAAFFQIELDLNGERYTDKKQSKSYQLFTSLHKCNNRSKETVVDLRCKDDTLKRFEISLHDTFIDKYQGEIPSIYCILYRQVNEDSTSLRTFIRDTFERYRKLIENIEPVLVKDYKDLHENIVCFLEFNVEKTTRHQVVNSLKSLSQLMYIYFNRKCFLFIEDYDNLAHRDIKNNPNEIEERFELLNDFYEATLVHNDFYEKAFITGKYNLHFKCFDKISKFKSYNFINDCVYYKFFSFSDDEIIDSINEHDISSYRMRFKPQTSFGGYKISSECNQKVHCPGLIHQFLNETYTQFCKGPFHGCLYEALSSKSVTDKLKILETKEIHELSHDLVFKIEDILLLHDIITNENFEMDPPSWDLILACMVTEGLLTLDDNKSTNTFHKVKIPNIWVKNYFKKRNGLFRNLSLIRVL